MDVGQTEIGFTADNIQITATGESIMAALITLAPYLLRYPNGSMPKLEHLTRLLADCGTYRNRRYGYEFSIIGRAPRVR